VSVRHVQAHPVFRSILAAMAPAVEPEPEMRVCHCGTAYEVGETCCEPENTLERLCERAEAWGRD
jgi:hypothetical protein